MQHSKLSLIVLAVFFSSISLFAQTDSVKYNSQIQFHLYGSYSLSYLNFISPNSAIRYTADLYLRFGGIDGTSSDSFQSGTTFNSKKEQSNQNNISVNLSTQYLFYLQAKEKINLYAGGGPLINYSKNYRRTTTDYEQSLSQPNPTKGVSEGSGYSFGLGVRGVAGIECYITKEISLLAEYGIYFSYNWEKTTWTGESKSQTNVYVSKGETDNKFWDASLNSIKLGVSYRF